MYIRKHNIVFVCVCVCVCARTCVHGYVHMCMVVRLCLHINFVLGCVCICVDAMSYSMCSDTIPLQGPLSFDFSGQPVEVRAAVQQYRVQPSGNLSKADIGEIDYTSNRVDLNVSIGEIFPSEELCNGCCVVLCVWSAGAAMHGVQWSIWGGRRGLECIEQGD